MVKAKLKYIWLIILTVALQDGHAQGHLFSKVEFNRNTVFVGQPVEVTVSVFTSTWFTSGVDPGNIKVNGAFTVYFRSVTETKKIEGKTYAGVNMIYNVFPYEEGEIEFPSVTFQVETPDEGDYKGKPRTVKTSPRTIKVSPVPSGFDRSAWVVTTSLSVKDNWKGNKSTIKVGDVLERTIERTLSNTVAELIPPVNWDSTEKVSLYPTRSNLVNNKSKSAISATRTDGMRYLFLEEGEVTIPEHIFTWYNPYQRKLYKKTLKAQTFTVAANPDLGMLKTVSDSLALEELANSEEAALENPTILGMSYKKFTLTALSVLGILAILAIITIRIWRWVKIQRTQYLNSERYYFKCFKDILRSRNPSKILNALYSWLDKVDYEGHTVVDFINEYGSNDILQELTKIEEAINNREQLNFIPQSRVWDILRKNYLKTVESRHLRVKRTWINPILEG